MKYPSYSPPSMFFYCRHNPYQFLDIAVHIFSFVTHDITLLVDCPPNKEPLDWNTRMKIAAGAAKGLEYLHDKANPPVIYRDFKSSIFFWAKTTTLSCLILGSQNLVQLVTKLTYQHELWEHMDIVPLNMP